MAVGRMIVIIRSVQIGRHTADIIGSVLTVQELAVFQTTDLCQCISLIGLLQFRSQQTVLFHRLRSHSRINTAGSKEQKLFTVIFPCFVDHIHLKNHIVIHKVSQSFAVCDDSTYFCSSQKYIIRLLLCEEFFHLILTGQVQFFMGSGNNIVVSVSLQRTYNARSYHSPMTCYINLSIFIHHDFLSPVYCTFLNAASLFASSRSCFAMISTSSW